MKLWISIGVVILLIAVGWVFLVPKTASVDQNVSATVNTDAVQGASTNDADQLLMKEVRLPVHFESGNLKVQMLANSAVMPDEGDIKAWNVNIEYFKPNGDLDGMLTTAACVYNKTNSEVTSDSDVRLEKQGVVITGTGFDWKAEDQMVFIHHNVRVVINGGMKKEGGKKWGKRL